MTNPYGVDQNNSVLSTPHAAAAIVIGAVVGLVLLNRLAVSLRVGG